MRFNDDIKNAGTLCYFTWVSETDFPAVVFLLRGIKALLTDQGFHFFMLLISDRLHFSGGFRYRHDKRSGPGIGNCYLIPDIEPEVAKPSAFYQDVRVLFRRPVEGHVFRRWVNPTTQYYFSGIFHCVCFK